MPDIKYYLSALGTTLRTAQIGQPQLPDIDRVDFLRYATTLSPDALYVSTPEEASVFFRKNQLLPDHLFLSAAGTSGEVRFPAVSNLVISSLELLPLHAVLSGVAATYRSWRRIFDSRDENSASITPQLVHHASELSGASIFVMNAGYQVDFFVVAPQADNALSRRLVAEQYLPMDMILRLFENSDIDWTRDYAKISNVAAAEGCCCHVRRLYEQGVVIGSILAVSKPNYSFDMETLLDCLGTVLMRNGIHLDLRSMPSKSRLQSMLGSILEDPHVDSNPFFRLLQGEDAAAGTTGYLVVITEIEDRGKDTLPSAEIMRRLSVLLKKAFSIVYDGRIVSILTNIPVGPRSYNQIFRSGNEEDTRRMLESCGAYMQVGIPTNRTDRLFTMYTTARYMMKISRGMEAGESNRLFYEVENRMFLVIALGAERFADLVGHEDYAYLNNPNIMELQRYDQANNQNLSQVLYHYLVNGGDIQKTSAMLYMHRNTVKNKLDRIQKLVEIDYAAGADRMKYLFGLLLDMYFRKCLAPKPAETRKKKGSLRRGQTE